MASTTYKLPGEIRSPIKWVGGKGWLAERLKLFHEKHGENYPRLVEPFCGSCAVTMFIRPKEALLNDLNPHLINLWKWIQYDGLELELHMENDEDLYYEYRTEFNKKIEKREANTREGAELFYYLVKTCYNGVARFNKRGYFNTPFGTHKRIWYPKAFHKVKEVIKDYEFTCQDFDSLTLDPERDMVYADPPYHGTYSQYTKEGFTWEDQERVAKRLSQHKGPVLISNSISDEITALYHDYGFNLAYMEGPGSSRVNSEIGQRKKTKEILAMKGPTKGKK